MPEHVILFTGPMGAGKTTAIRTISEIDVVSTEAGNTDRAAADKPTTTVALDYGEILLSDEEKVRLYGIPGQRRFEFMWRILRERAVGMVLLVDNTAPDPIADALEYLEAFEELLDRGGVVVGITRMDGAQDPSVLDFSRALLAARPGITVPVFAMDPRLIGDVRLALLSLIANIDMRAAFGRAEVPTP